MKEIKFIAWDKIEEIMSEVVQIDFLEKTVILKNDIYEDDNCYANDYIGRDFEDVVLMKYTGLKNQKGQEIYEGDIVKSWWDEPFISCLEQDYEIGEIIYNENMQGYSLKIKYKDEDLTPMMNCFNKFEIIGNKYENSKLLAADVHDKN